MLFLFTAMFCILVVGHTIFKELDNVEADVVDILAVLYSHLVTTTGRKLSRIGNVVEGE